MLRFLYYLLPLLLFAILYHFATPDGLIDYGFDSQEYSCAANSYAETGVFKERNDRPYVHYPPFYPFILSYLVPDINGRAKWMHLFCWLVVLGGWLAIIRALVLDEKLKWIVAFLVCGSVYAVELGRFLWSESLFTLFYSLFLWCYWRGWKSKQNRERWGLLLLAFCVGSLMVLTRSAGMIFIVFVSCCQLLVFVKAKKWVGFFPLIGISVVHVWYRTQVIDHLATGRLSHLPVLKRFSQLLERIDWYYNQYLDYFLPLLPIEGIGGVFCVLTIFTTGLWYGRKMTFEQCLPLVFTFFYIHFMLFLIFFKDFGTFEDTARFMNIAGMFFYVSFVLVLRQVFEVKKWSLNVMYGVVLLMFVLNISRTIFNILRWNNLL